MYSLKSKYIVECDFYLSNIQYIHSKFVFLFLFFWSQVHWTRLMSFFFWSSFFVPNVPLFSVSSTEVWETRVRKKKDRHPEGFFVCAHQHLSYGETSWVRVLSRISNEWNRKRGQVEDATLSLKKKKRVHRINKCWHFLMLWEGLSHK